MIVVGLNFRLRGRVELDAPRWAVQCGNAAFPPPAHLGVIAILF